MSINIQTQKLFGIAYREDDENGYRLIPGSITENNDIDELEGNVSIVATVSSSERVFAPVEITGEGIRIIGTECQGAGVDYYQIAV